MADVVGFAFLWLSVTPVGKLVFLRVVSAIPNAMLRMTTTAATVQKAAGGRKKRPPLAVKKQEIESPSPTILMMWELIVGPSLTLPKGREFVLAVFEEVVVRYFPLGKAGMGPLFWLFSLPLGKVRMGPWWTGRTPGNSVGVAIS